MTVPRLLLLTDRSQLHLGRGLVRTVAECVDAGLTHVVVRELDEPIEQRTALAERLVRTGARVIAAREPLPGCVGVHLAAGQQGSPLSAPLEARCSTRSGHRTVGDGGPVPGAWFGRSCHSAEEVRRAAAEGAAYATLSPFTATGSKPGYGPPVPPEAYAGHPIPVLALGGITPDNAAEAIAAGAHGVAVMGAVMRADDPAAVVRGLLEVIP